MVVIKEVIKEVEKEVIVYKEKVEVVTVEKKVEVPIETIKTVFKTIEIPIESIKIETIEKIIEKIVEVEKIVKVEVEKDDDCECISEASFIALWNKMMILKFQDVKEGCLSDDRFTDLIMENL